MSGKLGGTSGRAFLSRIGLLNEISSMQDLTQNPVHHPAKGFCANDECRPVNRDIKWYSVARAGVLKFATDDKSVSQCTWCDYYLYWSRSYQIVDAEVKAINDDLRGK